MKKIVRNFEAFNQYYDIDSNSFITSISVMDIIGWYKTVDKFVSILFVKNNKLNISLGDVNHQVNDNTQAKIEDLSDKMKRFMLLESNKVILFFDYDFQSNYSATSPFEYIDDEDFDWGLYLSNIVNNKNKRNNIILQLGGNLQG